MSNFAVALARTDERWTGREVDLDEVESIEDVVEVLHEVDEAAETMLLFVEEDDEYVAIVRADAGKGELRIFVSDSRAVSTYQLVELFSDEAGLAPAPLPDTDDVDEDTLGHDSEPFGDASLLADLGTSTAELLELCAHEGTLPSDVISAVCERAGCLDDLEALREEVG